MELICKSFADLSGMFIRQGLSLGEARSEMLMMSPGFAEDKIFGDLFSLAFHIEFCKSKIRERDGVDYAEIKASPDYAEMEKEKFIHSTLPRQTRSLTMLQLAPRHTCPRPLLQQPHTRFRPLLQQPRTRGHEH